MKNSDEFATIDRSPMLTACTSVSSVSGRSAKSASIWPVHSTLKRAMRAHGFGLVTAMAGHHIVGPIGHDATDPLAPTGDVSGREPVLGLAAIGVDFFARPAARREACAA